MDLEFISGDFFEIALPKDKVYLTRYFKTDSQRQFLRYMMVFGDWRFFCEHTGYACTQRNLQLLNRRRKELEDAYAKSKADLDFDALERIEKGKYRFPR